MKRVSIAVLVLSSVAPFVMFGPVEVWLATVGEGIRVISAGSVMSVSLLATPIFLGSVGSALRRGQALLEGLDEWDSERPIDYMDLRGIETERKYDGSARPEPDDWRPRTR